MEIVGVGQGLSASQTGVPVELITSATAVAQRKNASDSCTIRQAKFLRVVRPGDRLVIRWTARMEGDIQFECRLPGAERPALTGTLRIGRANQ